MNGELLDKLQLDAIKSDLKTAQENKDHIFIQNKEFQDLYTLIDDGITGYRSFVTSDQVGILPLLVNEAQTRLHRKAMIMLKSTKDDGTPMYSQAQFQNEMRQSAIRFIINSVALINAGGDQAVFDEQKEAYINQWKQMMVILQ